MSSKVILVAGASSGLGLAVADHLSGLGHTVYAGARSFQPEKLQNENNGSGYDSVSSIINGSRVNSGNDTSKINRRNDTSIENIANTGSSVNSGDNIETGNKGKIYRVFLDVTDRESINDALRQIIQNEGKLDVMVSCAAYIILGSVEDISVDEYKHVMETCFIGTLNMCKSVLPVMRKQKDGLIINFSSLNGLFGIPFTSAYVASKFAIEGLTECLSMEVKRFGIRVVMIEPSDHRSGSVTYRSHAAKADSTDSPYYSEFKAGTKKIAWDEENGSDPKGVARLIARIVEKRRPRLRYSVGRFYQRLVIIIKKIIPGRIFEEIILDHYKTGPVKK